MTRFMMEFETSLILVLLTGFTLVSGQEDDYRSYLERAINMIGKAKDNIPKCMEGNNTRPTRMRKPVDCSEVRRMGYNTSGVYEIFPMYRVTDDKPLKVFCDMETDNGGWTVIQRRGDFGNPKGYFNRDWKSYKEGFGDVDKDFYLGNQIIFGLTNQKMYSVRFDLKDFRQEQRYALYSHFWVDGEHSLYTLHISNYSGNAGDAMLDSNNQMFSTHDKDNDRDDNVNCAKEYRGGWWFKNCKHASLNGVYRRDQDGSRDGILWMLWSSYSLAWAEIKIRPTYFLEIKGAC